MFFETVGLVFLGIIILGFLISTLWMFNDFDEWGPLPFFYWIMFSFVFSMVTLRYEYLPIDATKISRVSNQVVYVISNETIISSNKAMHFNATNDKLYIQKSYAIIGLDSHKIVLDTERDIPVKK